MPQEFTDTRVGVGIHLQMQVPDVDDFYQHCLDEGAMLSVSGEPTDQEWGWREFALRDPDGYRLVGLPGQSRAVSGRCECPGRPPTASDGTGLVAASARLRFVGEGARGSRGPRRQEDGIEPLHGDLRDRRPPTSAPK